MLYIEIKTDCIISYTILFLSDIVCCVDNYDIFSNWF